MGGLQVGVRLVLGMTQPVVLERQDLVRRLRDAAQRGAGRDAVVVRLSPVFIDIVAQVHDGVEARLLRQGVIGVEQAAGVELAGGHAQDDVGRRADGQGADPTGRRDHLPGDETVEILGARLQPLTVQIVLDGEVACGAGAQAGRGADDFGEGGVARDFQRHLDVGARGVGGCHPGPEDGRMRIGIARCDSVQEGDRRGLRRGGERRRGDRAGPDQAQQAAAVEGHGKLRRQNRIRRPGEPGRRRGGACPSSGR